MMPNHEDFVRVWRKAAREGKNVKWVAGQFSIGIDKATSRAFYLRKKGVGLPQLERQVGRWAVRRIDVEKLNKIE